MSFTNIDERIALSAGVSIAAADTTTLKSFYTADAQTRRIDSVIISSTDTVDRAVQFTVTINATDFPLSEVNIPAGAGHGAVPAVELFQALNLTNQVGIVLGPTSTLKVNAVATLTAAKAITLVASGGVM